MSEHTDADGGVEESVHTAARTALTVALQLGERLARLREEMAREAQRRDTDAARELAARFDGERAVAVAQLEVVNRPEWWERASVQDVAQVAETAEAWSGFDPRAEAARDVIGRQVQERYGIDTASLVAEADRLDRAANARTVDSPDGAGSVAAQLEAQAVTYEAAASRGGDGGRNPDELRALASDARDQAQLHPDPAPTAETAGAAAATVRADAGNDYDSAERREAFAASMEGKASPEDIAVRMRADMDQARPAYEALTARSGPGRTRGGSTPTGGRTREREGRAR